MLSQLKYLETVIIVTFLCLLIEGLDEGLNSNFGQSFTTNYSKIKTGFICAFSSLTLQVFTILYFSYSSLPGIIFLRIIRTDIIFLNEMNIFSFP